MERRGDRCAVDFCTLPYTTEVFGLRREAHVELGGPFFIICFRSANYLTVSA